VKINISILAITLTCGSFHQAQSCSCGHVGIEKEVGRAFDIVVGKIVSERTDEIACEYSLNNKTYESFTSFAYSFETEFSYKGKLEGTTTILGGKGGGDCGGIFEIGKAYLIVVFKCEKGYYTYLCSDNELKSKASTQITFLNEHFKEVYEINASNVSIPAILFASILISVAVLLALIFRKRRFGKSTGSDLG
jgi:hypothetical protein